MTETRYVLAVVLRERRDADLQGVLAAIVPGRVVRLNLTREQKHALRDPTRGSRLTSSGTYSAPAPTASTANRRGGSR